MLSSLFVVHIKRSHRHERVIALGNHRGNGLQIFFEKTETMPNNVTKENPI